MASKIMIIRHAEKAINNDQTGVNINGHKDDESLIPQGWQRAGALASFFDPSRPWPIPGIVGPASLFAADPGKHDQHSERPEETITPLALKLNLTINTQFKKDDFASMVSAAQACSGVVLIAWQHQDIPSIGNLLMGNNTTVPQTWPGNRYDIVWVFDNDGAGGYTFSQVPQELLAGDLPSVI